jgi:transcriptional regulator with XRE-family HTH domain
MSEQRSGGVRLTDAQVVELRERYAAGERQVDLAAAFGVKQTTVSAIVTGKTRAAAGGPIATPAQAKKKPPSTTRPATASARKAALTTDQVEAIRARVEEGESRAAVAEALGVSIHTVHSIMSGRRTGRAEVPARQFSEAEIVQMRELFSQGESQASLAQRFDTQQQAVSQIVRGATYGDIGGPIT